MLIPPYLVGISFKIKDAYTTVFGWYKIRAYTDQIGWYKHPFFLNPNLTLTLA